MLPGQKRVVCVTGNYENPIKFVTTFFSLYNLFPLQVVYLVGIAYKEPISLIWKDNQAYVLLLLLLFILF